MRRPDFGRQKDIAALDAGGMQALAYFTLIIVHLRGVDVAVAEPQRLFHHANASPPAQIPGAEPNERDLGAVRSDARCWPNRAHASHCGACGGLTIRESGRWSFAISAISASLSLRSRLPRFSASRSRFEVRGIVALGRRFSTRFADPLQHRLGGHLAARQRTIADHGHAV